MTEPAEDEVDRLLRSGHDVLPESYSPTTTTRRGKNVVTTQQGSTLPRSPAFRKLGQSIARTDQDVIHRVRSDIGQLRNRTQKIQKAFESARLRRKRASKKVNAGVRVSRNRMDPRYLRERGPQFYKERLVETLRKLIQKQWLRRWDVVVRAIQYEEMEQRRREEERERKRHAAIMLSKLLTFHYSFYMRWAKRRRFLRWFDRMMIIRRRVMAISARKIQSLIRGHLVRAERRRMHLAAIVIQKHARAKIARRFVRRRRAAIKLQRTFRHFLRMSRGARKIQSVYRMWSIRRAYVMLEREARERRSLLYLSLSLTHTHTYKHTRSSRLIIHSTHSTHTHTHTHTKQVHVRSQRLSCNSRMVSRSLLEIDYQKSCKSTSTMVEKQNELSVNHDSTYSENYQRISSVQQVRERKMECDMYSELRSNAVSKTKVQNQASKAQRSVSSKESTSCRSKT